ncbi:hypothetical protein [Saccharothrix coeruleofusca]|uniref:Lipoprotein n=1 Tax=Saccharothrix coeruleofusca TaxID=33919 RepID=A0A918AS97_9PSEU|nr:hypothetical protein [Saccharothrix coeruleofusca]GGP77188.1 hypothetical protein GCM10010185_58530 [Saccharothrix coeruleofusca]
MRVGVMLGGCAAAAALLVGSAACSAGGSTTSGPTLGATALGPPLTTTTQIAEWLREKTGECAQAEQRTMEQFAEFLGPLRTKLYAPYVAEWATCKVGPYERLGLVVFHRDRLAEFQKSWQAARASGEVGDDPDFGFGNGFALSGTLGLESLGLHHLRCSPAAGSASTANSAREADGAPTTDGGSTANSGSATGGTSTAESGTEDGGGHTLPAEAPGCVYIQPPGHHH